VALHGALAGVVGGQRQRQIAVEVTHQLTQVGQAAAQMLLRRSGPGDRNRPTTDAGTASKEGGNGPDSGHCEDYLLHR
jgi:hypothetical protein